MKRNRIHTRSGMIATSSNNAYCRAHKEELQRNHDENIEYFNSIKSSKSVKTETKSNFNYPYSKVKILGVWSPADPMLIEVYKRQGFELK